MNQPSGTDTSATRSRQMTLAVVGPVWPYRGGIAQYATRLNHALRPLLAKLEQVSFRRQYPRWLYPGNRDTEPGTDGRLDADVHYVLDPLSPLSWRRAIRLIGQRRCDAVIIHYWTLFWAPVFALMACVLRKRGVLVAFLCHNLADHDAGGIKVRLSNWMVSRADAYIVHSADQARALERLRPGAALLQRLHPIYDRFPRPTVKLPVRGRLEVLFFGFIRSYKGLPVLLEALRLLDDEEVHVTIVGESWDREDGARIEALRRQTRVNVEARLEYVDDETAAAYFDRADVVVLPYLNATGSGVVALAYHYGKPVIASAVGGLRDAVLPGTTGWLIEPGSAAELCDTLRSTCRNSTMAMKEGIASFVSENSWDGFASQVIDFIASTSDTIGRAPFTPASTR